MRHSPLLALALAGLLILGSCGDDDTATTVTTVAGTTVTTSGGESTTTAAASTEPLSEFLTAAVADPFTEGGGYHDMEWGDDTHQFLLSVDGLAGGGRLAVGAFDLPTPTGIGADQRLINVFNPESGEPVTPFGVALYRLGASGWDPEVVFLNAQLLQFLETTTDYQARMPAGTAVLHVFPSAFSWDGTLARMIAGVEVYDDLAATNVIYQGEVDCAVGADGGGCILLSDDGVLRPGDVEDAVQALEEDLQSIGYFPLTPDTIYDSDTENWVKNFQRDYRLHVDGKVGPQTAELIEAIASGTSDAVLAYPEGVEGVSFGSPVESALPQLVALLGTPDYSVGWEMSVCGPTPPYGGWEWYKVTWGGFTAWFTERTGPRLFDGWEITDLNTIPTNLYIAGGFGPATTWSDVAALGGLYDPFYGWWSAFDLGYGLGEFDVAPSNPPAGSAQVKGFGVGTAAILYDC